MEMFSGYWVLVSWNNEDLDTDSIVESNGLDLKCKIIKLEKFFLF